MVPCEGLYADIADDFLSQNMMKMSQELFTLSQELIQSNKRLQAVQTAFQQRVGGKTLFSPIHCNEKECLLGLQEWTPGNKRRNGFVQRQLSPYAMEDKIIDVKTLTNAYHNYKKEYVKSLSFSPEEKDLSESNFVAF